MKAELEYLHTSEEGYEELTGFRVRDVLTVYEQCIGELGGSPSRTAQHLVTARSPRVPERVSGSSLVLYPPQAALVAMMLLIEGPHSWVATPRLGAMAEDKPLALQSNVGLVHERMSFGKSTLIPALIRQQPVSQWTPHTAPRTFTKGPARVEDPVSSYFEGTHGCNVLVVAKVTVAEWRARLAGTALAAEFVETAAGLRKLVARLQAGVVPDVIVVRAGGMKHEGMSDLVLNHFVRATATLGGRRVAFSRVFYDDYDLLGLMPTGGSLGALMPLARFHWFLSATARAGKLFIGEGVGASTLSSVACIPIQVRKLLFKTRCDSNFSQLEYNVPPIHWLTASDLRATVLRLALDEPVKTMAVSRPSSAFIGGSTSVPYNRAVHGFKMLVSVEDRGAREELLASLLSAGVRAVALDKRNLHLFGESVATVGISRLIHGVSMGYLTHVVVLLPGEYDAAAVDQVVGRAQRIGRRHDLQALLVPSDYERGFQVGCSKRPSAPAPAGDGEYARGFWAAMDARGEDAARESEPLAGDENVPYAEAYHRVRAFEDGYCAAVAGDASGYEPPVCSLPRELLQSEYDRGFHEGTIDYRHA